MLLQIIVQLPLLGDLLKASPVLLSECTVTVSGGRNKGISRGISALENSMKCMSTLCRRTLLWLMSVESRGSAHLQRIKMISMFCQVALLMCCTICLRVYYLRNWPYVLKCFKCIKRKYFTFDELNKCIKTFSYRLLGKTDAVPSDFCSMRKCWRQFPWKLVIAAIPAPHNWIKNPLKPNQHGKFFCAQRHSWACCKSHRLFVPWTVRALEKTVFSRFSNRKI